MEKDHSELIKQIEYYFSDKNLEFDEFFLTEIESSTEGFISLQILLQCNKIKKMNIDHEDLVNAVETSELLELGPDKKFLRRIDRLLPEFKGTRRARPESPRKLPRKGSQVSHKELEDAAIDKDFLAYILTIPDISK